MAATQDEAGIDLYRYRFGSAEFDHATFVLRIDGQEVEVQRRPLEVLLELLTHPNEVMTGQQLRDSVWRRPTVENVLGNAVKKLRAALGPNASFIENRHGAGYCFVGPLERVAVGSGHGAGLALERGAVVPGRSEFVLEECLSCSAHNEVWRARHAVRDERRIYKFSSDGDGLTRLKREATVARVLRTAVPDRDDVVRVIGHNFSAPPFFLESADGGDNLADWATQDDHLQQMDVGQRVALFLGVADAVAAAHAIGVLHKDLKPANVLIDATGHVRLGDFGSSRLLEPERLAQLGITKLGFTVTTVGAADEGTVFYLAPELLAKQPPTVRSDIYALGVMLYQLVAGDLAQPLNSGWERNIDDELIRADIARATDGDPAQRFASVEDFAANLRALTRRRAEQQHRLDAARAAETTRLAYLRERARRPWLVATIIVLSLGLGVVIWFATQLAAATTTATTAAERADATKSFLLDMLRGADPARGKGYDITLKEALRRAAAQIPTRFAATPLTETEVQQTAADLYVSLSDFEAAIGHMERAVELLRAQVGGKDARTLQARYKLGQLLAGYGNLPQAEQALRSADLDAAGLVPEQNLSMALAGAIGWTRLFFRKSRFSEALAHIDRSEKYQRALNPDDAAPLLSIRIDRAQVYNHTGRANEAVKLFAELDTPRNAETRVGVAMHAKARFVYGSALLYDGKLAQAQVQLEAALRSMSTIYGPSSARAMEVHVALGLLFANRNDMHQALEHVVPSREFFCKTYGSTYPNCLQQTGNEGILRLQLGDFAAAQSPIEQVLYAYQELGFGATSPAVQIFSFYLATITLELGRSAQAATLAAGLDAKVLAAASPGGGWDLRLQGLRGAILIAQGKRAEGQALLLPALATLEAEKAQEFVVAPLRRALQRSNNER